MIPVVTLFVVCAGAVYRAHYVIGIRCWRHNAECTTQTTLSISTPDIWNLQGAAEVFACTATRDSKSRRLMWSSDVPCVINSVEYVYVYVNVCFLFCSISLAFIKPNAYRQNLLISTHWKWAVRCNAVVGSLAVPSSAPSRSNDVGAAC